MNVRLLDCTLRDGGFINDWDFGKKTMRSIYRRLNKAGIDIIEIGFVDERRETDLSRSINPSASDFDEIFKGVEKKSTTVAMIDYGTASIENIPDSTETFIDGFRVIFKKKDIPAALAFCRRLKEKGFFVSVQPVSVTTYSDREMLDLIDRINTFTPDCVSIVDTYGLLHKEKLMSYFYLLDHNLNPQTAIGFHSHNNFQMAYANSIEVLKAHTDRNLIIDATCYGMGKSAGNTCTELLAMYLNDNYGRNYSIAEILEIIDSDVIKIYEKSRWGYAYEYYISAQSKVHPKYVQYLEKKRTLTISGILSVLSRIPDNTKLTFDEKLIESIYRDYQEKDLDDTSAERELKEIFQNKSIVLLGPGTSILEYKNDILKTVAERNAVVVGVNCVPSTIKTDYVFISNAKRYEHLIDVLIKENKTIIAPSNVTPIDKALDYVMNFSKITNHKAKIIDNAITMILQMLVLLGIKKVMLAGFDGFSSQKENFYNPYMQFLNPPDDLEQRNREIAEDLKTFADKISMEFITPSKYTELMK